MDRYIQLSSGREQWSASSFLPRHFHHRAYAAIVLSGGYEEGGNGGRFRVGAGDVLIHNTFDAHLNRFEVRGATILNLELPGSVTGLRTGRVADPDAIVRTAETDAEAAIGLLFTQLSEGARAADDWPDILAAEILRDPSCRLDRWAVAWGIAPETLSRGFGRLYGTTPAGFRAETRARRAFEQIVQSATPLAEIATLAGFADQAHMTRAVRALTGAPPRDWRRGSNLFKTTPGRSR